MRRHPCKPHRLLDTRPSPKRPTLLNVSQHTEDIQIRWLTQQKRGTFGSPSLAFGTQIDEPSIFLLQLQQLPHCGGRRNVSKCPSAVSVRSRAAALSCWCRSCSTRSDYEQPGKLRETSSQPQRRRGTRRVPLTFPSSPSSSFPCRPASSPAAGRASPPLPPYPTHQSTPQRRRTSPQTRHLQGGSVGSNHKHSVGRRDRQGRKRATARTDGRTQAGKARGSMHHIRRARFPGSCAPHTSGPETGACGVSIRAGSSTQ